MNIINQLYLGVGMVISYTKIAAFVLWKDSPKDITKSLGRGLDIQTYVPKIGDYIFFPLETPIPNW